MLPVAHRDSRGSALPYAEIRDLALMAEAAGFDGAWIPDHLIFRFDDEGTKGVWEAWSLLAGLAEATDRIGLGTLVMCTSFRNPALLAKMAVTVDEISGGRLTLGIGCGWHEPEYTAFGYPFDHRVSRFAEALSIIRPLLRGESATHEGRYERAVDARLLPAGPRPGGIPILIAAKGDRMLRLTARHADAWNTAWFGEPSELLGERRAALEAASSEEGRALGSGTGALEETVGVLVRFPDLPEADEEDEPVDARRVLSGSVERIAEVLGEYERLGIGQVMLDVDPMVPRAVERLGRSLALYREASAGGAA